MPDISAVRKAYLEHSAHSGHVLLPSASLVPENDATTLFTGSGMQPLVPYLLGQPHPAGARVANSQKCFRAEDIDEVGDNRHTTFFEMLGNWSFGDYFKKEQLASFFVFLTDGLGIAPERIYVSVFMGDEKSGVPRDEESAKIWQELFAQKGIKAEVTEGVSSETGMRGGRIFYYGARKNWWSRAGGPEAMPAGEPGGPDSEVFYEFTQVSHDTRFGAECHPNCDCGRFMEIGNSVFMEYRKRADGGFDRLSQRNVDFGGGLERVAAAAADEPDIYRAAEPLLDIIAAAEKLSGRRYGADAGETSSFRLIADHLRASVFMLDAGIEPSNTERGYILRRLIRRMVRRADMLGLPEYALAGLSLSLPKSYSGVYPEIGEKIEKIAAAVRAEEEKFRVTLKRGLGEFRRAVLSAGKKSLSGDEAFYYFQSFGFPKEMMLELGRENGISVDAAGFDTEYEKHQELSRAGSVQKFAGGLADRSAATTALHTATHLLHQSLRNVLGGHVEQKGSNITAERLRFDFKHPAKMSPEEIAAVEKMVNEQIEKDLEVVREEMTPAEAKSSGAIGLFGEKYGEMVSVYSVAGFSKEICGGPHVSRTGGMGKFRILKEEAVGSGVRRIKAVLE